MRVAATDDALDEIIEGEAALAHDAVDLRSPSRKSELSSSERSHRDAAQNGRLQRAGERERPEHRLAR
jgi:hypothetical protein